MTREAKIGMLTGLGVIVLIGVLLSEYLGDKAGTGGAAPTKMAQLPIGQTYRQQVMEPVAAPNLTRSEMPMAEAPLVAPAAVAPAPQVAINNNATNVVTDLTAGLAPGMGSMTQVPPAYAAQPRMEQPAQVVPAVAVGPRMAEPVSLQPLPAGQPEVPALAGGTPPTITLEPMGRGDTAAVMPVSKTTVTADPVKVTGVQYTILPGDNLAKISKKFFGQAKESDVKRIVAANPGMLKDVNTPLMAGKKLTIPVAASTPVAPAPVAPVAVAKTPAAGKKAEPSMVYLPGDVKASAVKDTAKAAAPAGSKKEASKTYTVVSGDSLEKIAKKLAPGNTRAMMDKLRQANGFKGTPELKIGQTLKVPV